uniref:Intraflagellar transport protein 56 n=1 Tax=Romanomermis culicivorax TaxID=13658 RepID=A0A915KVI2_ROMCU
MIPTRLIKQQSEQAASSILKEKGRLPDVVELITNRDYSGAISLLNFNKQNDSVKVEDKVDLWLAYCSFHAGNYKKAAENYEKIAAQSNAPSDIYACLACCQLYLGLYELASETAQKSVQCSLKNRLLFYICHKLSDEKRLLFYHSKLQDILEDQLCLANIHFSRSHYQEATEIYKKILLQHRNYIALNVYLALCYYKLDFYDVSLWKLLASFTVSLLSARFLQEVLQIYLQKYPDSPIALNLKACIQYKLYDGKAAYAEIKNINPVNCSYIYHVIKHNMIVFRKGENALQIFPPLLDVVSEARLNLVLCYLSKNEVENAYDFIKNFDVVSPLEANIKAIVFALVGQKDGNHDLLENAQKLFSFAGGSQPECDTIPGRQCMASAFFLMKQYEECLIYLNSIKSYMSSDDNFNFMLGQALAASGNYKEAEEALLLISSETLKLDYAYVSNISRSYIMNDKPKLAWDLYSHMEKTTLVVNLLQLIANDCYRVNLRLRFFMGHFLYAAKAFDALERLDKSTDNWNGSKDYWNGKRGACVGIFQMVVAGREPRLFFHVMNFITFHIFMNPKAWYR